MKLTAEYLATSLASLDVEGLIPEVAYRQLFIFVMQHMEPLGTELEGKISCSLDFSNRNISLVTRYNNELMVRRIFHSDGKETIEYYRI